MFGKHFVVSGKVQNVGFRRYVQVAAEELGIDGKVWNTRDGNVEVIARLSSEEIEEKFRERLRSGPGRVDSITWFECAVPTVSGFHIAPTR